MKENHRYIDADVIEFYMRKAHAERSRAMTGAIGGLSELVKNIFTNPSSGRLARGH